MAWLKSSNPLKSWYLKSLSKSLEIEEVSIINDVDAIATITNEDEGWINQRTDTLLTMYPLELTLRQTLLLSLTVLITSFTLGLWIGSQTLKLLGGC